MKTLLSSLTVVLVIVLGTGTWPVHADIYSWTKGGDHRHYTNRIPDTDTENISLFMKCPPPRSENSSTDALGTASVEMYEGQGDSGSDRTSAHFDDTEAAGVFHEIDGIEPDAPPPAETLSEVEEIHEQMSETAAKTPDGAPSPY